MYNLGFSHHRIFVIDHRVDFRLRHNGLLAIAYSLQLDPFAGDVIVFVSRNRREVRVLNGDTTGIWLHSKIFTEQAIRTQFSFLIDPHCRKITAGDLAMLLEGAAYEVKKRLKPLPRAA
jgi:hypothetical protein